MIKEKLEELNKNQEKLNEKKEDLIENKNSVDKYETELKDIEIKELQSELKEQENLHIIKINELKRDLLKSKVEKNDSYEETLELLRLELDKCKKLKITIDNMTNVNDMTIPINVKPKLNVKLINSMSNSRKNSVTLKLNTLKLNT